MDHEASTDEKTVTIQVRPSVAGTKYYITDHLGSVRSTVNHLGQVVGQEDFWSYGLTMPGRSWNNGNAYDRYKFTGHERDSEGGLDMDYMIARNGACPFGNPEIGRFMGVDPLFAARLNLSPYNYTQNNPILRIDPDGLTDYKYNESTGALEIVGDPNDDPDRILKTDSDGNVKRKGEGIFGFMVRKSKRGQAKVAIDGIAKGILEDGIMIMHCDFT